MESPREEPQWILDFTSGRWIDYAQHKAGKKEDIVGGRSLKERKSVGETASPILSRKCISFFACRRPVIKNNCSSSPRDCVG